LRHYVTSGRASENTGPLRPGGPSVAPFSTLPNASQLTSLQQTRGNIVNLFYSATQAINQSVPNVTAASLSSTVSSSTSSASNSSASLSSTSDSTSSPSAASSVPAISANVSTNSESKTVAKRRIAEPSELARDRQLKQRKATKTRSKARRSTGVAVGDRLREFPNENLTVDGGELLCRACGNKPIANVRSTIANHVTSVRPTLKTKPNFLRSPEDRRRSEITSKNLRARKTATPLLSDRNFYVRKRVRISCIINGDRQRRGV